MTIPKWAWAETTITSVNRNISAVLFANLIFILLFLLSVVLHQNVKVASSFRFPLSAFRGHMKLQP
jgi:hypothetical protein